MERTSESTKTAMAVKNANSIYQGSVASRALDRAGHCKNLKGHIFEICYKDTINFDPRNILMGKKAFLTQSPVAVRDDIIVKQGEKIIQRVQCKDTPSISGVRDTVKRITEGQYARTNVVGTRETSVAVNKQLENAAANTSTRVKDSGISTKTTDIIACQANGANPLEHLDLIAGHAKSSAVCGAVVGLGISAAVNGRAIYCGKKDIDEAAVKVAADTGRSAAAATVAGVVDVSVTMAAATVPALLPISKGLGIAAGTAAGFCTDKVFGTVYHKIDTHMYKSAVKRLTNTDDAFGYLKRSGEI